MLIHTHSKGRLVLQIAWQLHPHKNPSSKERNQNAEEGNRDEQDSVQFWGGRVVCPVQNDETHSTERE